MTRADNTHHLRKAVQQRQASTRHRAETALQDLLNTHQTITVTSLARAASVARSWIYSQPDLLARIERSRDSPPTPSLRTIQNAATETSWQQRLDLAHQRIRELTTENKQLRAQLARAHGHLRAQRTTS